VVANEDVSASFSRQYAIGRKGWIDVLNAQRELTQARYAATDAEWAGRLAQLRMAISTFDPALTPSLAEPAPSAAK
jgi:adhesin transport system outer membrane protein